MSLGDAPSSRHFRTRRSTGRSRALSGPEPLRGTRARVSTRCTKPGLLRKRRPISSWSRPCSERRTMRRSMGVKPVAAMEAGYPSLLRPCSEHVPCVDAGAVAVVPAQAEPPRPDQFGSLGPQRLRARRLRPRYGTLVPDSPALGARAVDAELLEVEARHDVVVPHDRETTIALEVDGGGLLRRRHRTLRLPCLWHSDCICPTPVLSPTAPTSCGWHDAPRS